MHFQCPIILSIIAENAAIPIHPKHIACGPCFMPNAAPVAHPAYTEFIMSVLPRIFSITHSDPMKIADTKAHADSVGGTGTHKSARGVLRERACRRATDCNTRTKWRHKESGLGLLYGERWVAVR